MSRRQLTPSASLEERLANEAIRLRGEAELLPPGLVRDAVLRKARQAETGSQINAWLKSTDLAAPK